jgi:hypothetical protein
MIGGLASGMAYVGADRIGKLCGKADFLQVTSAGRTEGEAHFLKDNFAKNCLIVKPNQCTGI